LVRPKAPLKANRDGVVEHFPDPSGRKSIEVDLQLLDFYDRLLSDLECYIETSAKGHNVHTWYLLRNKGTEGRP
jgi:hypothetical protein